MSSKNLDLPALVRRRNRAIMQTITAVSLLVYFALVIFKALNN